MVLLSGHELIAPISQSRFWMLRGDNSFAILCELSLLIVTIWKMFIGLMSMAALEQTKKELAIMKISFQKKQIKVFAI